MREVNPKETSRAQAFELWMSSPQPMVTFVKTFNVSRLLKMSQRTGIRFNVLLCWCIGKAANQIEEFYLLPQDGKLFRYDKLALNVIIQNKNGGLSTCDIPFSDDIRQFNSSYLELTDHAAQTCENTSLDDYMIIGTSAMPHTELDSIINQYSGQYNNPFLAWGRYHKGWLKTTLPISFQFHHTQMDGAHAGKFFASLQEEINEIYR
ncbi:MAG: chloramphenicol acetyltransferase [Prevotella sp.]|nr:chloramphenicol acetyltransferase [Prevotella sp.]